jgi:hypothetical protein
MFTLSLCDTDSSVVFYCESDTLLDMFSQYDVFIEASTVKYERAIISKDGQHWITTDIIKQLKQLLLLF